MLWKNVYFAFEAIRVFFSWFFFIEICTISWIFGRPITSIFDIIPHTFITFMDSSKTNYILQGRRIPASLLYFSECVGSRVSLHPSLSANISNKESNKTVLSKDTKETFTDWKRKWRLIRLIRIFQFQVDESLRVTSFAPQSSSLNETNALCREQTGQTAKLHLGKHNGPQLTCRHLVV